MTRYLYCKKYKCFYRIKDGLASILVKKKGKRQEDMIGKSKKEKIANIERQYGI